MGQNKRGKSSMSINFEEVVAEQRKRADVESKKLAIFEDALKRAAALSGDDSDDHSPAPDTGVKRRGRPPGSTNKNKTVTGTGKPGRPPGSGGKVKLPGLVMEILGKHPDGMTLADLAKAVKATGYKSNGKTELPKLISQALYNLQNRQSVQRDEKEGKWMIAA